MSETSAFPHLHIKHISRTWLISTHFYQPVIGYRSPWINIRIYLFAGISGHVRKAWFWFDFIPWENDENYAIFKNVDRLLWYYFK